jgi:uncharacterized protein
MELIATNQQTPFWSWRDILVGGLLGLPLFIAAASISALVVAVLPGDKPKAIMLLVPQFAGFAAGLIPFIFLFRVRYDRPLWRSMNFSLAPGEWYRSLVSGIGLAALVMVTAVLLKPPRIYSPIQELMNDPASAPFLAIAAITAAPLFEELFFRGLLQPLLIRDLGIILGLTFSALPFALLHGPEFSWSWRHILLIAIAGTGFAVKRYTSGSTGAATITHAAYNAVITGGHLLGRNLTDG